jgi:hypothetical protein
MADKDGEDKYGDDFREGSGLSLSPPSCAYGEGCDHHDGLTSGAM